MKYLYLLCFLFTFQALAAQQITSSNRANFVLVIHGGAGTILKENMTVENEKAYKESLEIITGRL